MVNKVDSDGSGAIGFVEFVRMLSGRQVGALAQLQVQVAEFRLWYDLFDAGGDGIVENVELTDFLQTLGFPVSQGDLKEIVAECDENGNGIIEFREFVTVMTDILGNKVQLKIRRKLKEMKDLFHLFDIDGDGDVTVEELFHIMCCLGQKPSLEEVQKICNGDDADGNGCLDYGEFVRLMSRPDGHPAQRRLKQQLTEFRSCFNLFDLTRRGTLEPQEWVEGLKLLGLEVHIHLCVARSRRRVHSIHPPISY